MISTPPFATSQHQPRQSSNLSTPLSALGVAAALAIGLLSSDAAALTLGRLNVQSALGEPLRAEIEVTEITAAEADSLRVGLASRAAFEAAGVSYHDGLANVSTSLQRRADGRYVVRLSGNRPMSEPFVDVLLEANWATGRIVRDYTLLLDPPSTGRRSTAVAITPTAPQVVSPQPRAVAVAPTAPRSRAAAPAPVAAPAAAPTRSADDVDRTGGQQVTVQRGDTATRIAAAYKPADVSLDQMLVALLRANPDAFMNGNLNRLKAGAVMQLPSAADAANVPASEAKRVVVAQSRDFSKYRRQLADNAPTAQVAAADRQASGKLQANVQDRSAPATADRLTIAQGGAAAQTEERIAQTRQAQEAASRAAELQRNIDELNRVQNGAAAASAAKTATGASAAPTAPSVAPASPAPDKAGTTVPGSTVQASPPAIAATSATPAPVPADASTASAPAPIPESPAPVTASSAVPEPSPSGGDASAAATPAPTEANSAAPSEAAAAPAPAPAPRPRPAPPPPPPPPTFLEEMLANPIVPAGGAIALLLLGFLAYRLRNRKRTDAVDSVFPESKLPKDSFFGATGGESVDTSSRNSSGVSSLSYSPSQLDAGDVDPVAEADVYLAYGRDLQAEEILREALRTTPERVAIHLKLLEIHAKRRDLRAFEMLANDVRGLTGGNGADWARVLVMGQELDPGNPLYQGSAAVLDSQKTVPLAAASAAVATATAVASSSPAPAPAPAPVESQQPFVPSVAPLDFDLDLTTPPAPAPAPAAVPAPAPAPAPTATLAPSVPSAATSGFAASAPASLSLDMPTATPPAANYDSSASSPLMAFDPLDNDFETAPGELEPLAHLDRKASARPDDTDLTHPATLHGGLPGDSGFIEFDMTALSGISEAPSTRTGALDTTRAAAFEAPAAAPAPESPHAIKLSLARELHALGDADGARSLLEEVVAESDDDTGRQAQQLLAELR